MVLAINCLIQYVIALTCTQVAYQKIAIILLNIDVMIAYFLNGNHIARIDSQFEQPLPDPSYSITILLWFIQSLISLNHIQSNCTLLF